MKNQTAPLLTSVFMSATLLVSGLARAEPANRQQVPVKAERANSSRQQDRLGADSGVQRPSLQLKRDSAETSSSGSLPSLSKSRNEDRRDDQMDSLKLSGAGRNGPDRSGLSIPVTIDRGVTLYKFMVAKVTCEQQTSQELLSQMIRQQVSNLVFHSQYPTTTIFDLNGKPFYYRFEVQNPYLPSATKPTVYFHAGFAKGGSILYDVSTLTQNFVPTRFQVSLEIENLIATAYQEGASFSGGLMMSYDIKKDSGYDEMGSFNILKQLVVGYQVQASPLVRKVPNSDRTIPTPFSLSAEDFQQCMHNQLN
jgi:hypothetical protein